MCKQACFLQKESPTDIVGLGVSYKTYPEGSSSLYWDRSYDEFFFIPEPVHPRKDAIHIYYKNQCFETCFSIESLIHTIHSLKHFNRSHFLKKVTLKMVADIRCTKLYFSQKESPCADPFFEVQQGFRFFNPSLTSINWQGEGF